MICSSGSCGPHTPNQQLGWGGPRTLAALCRGGGPCRPMQCVCVVGICVICVTAHHTLYIDSHLYTHHRTQSPLCHHRYHKYQMTMDTPPIVIEILSKHCLSLMSETAHGTEDTQSLPLALALYPNTHYTLCVRIGGAAAVLPRLWGRASTHTRTPHMHPHLASTQVFIWWMSNDVFDGMSVDIGIGMSLDVAVKSALICRFFCDCDGGSG